MRLNIKLGKETSAQLAELIDKINDTKISDLDKVKSDLESKLNNLKPMLESIEDGDKLYEFLSNSINRQKDEIIFIDEDPNIIDNKKLVNIRTNKMDNKEKLMQEVDETLALLNKKQFSQLVVKYHEKLFSEVSDLDGEDLEELKDKLNEIADRIEDVLENEEIEVTDEQPAEEEVAEETTEEVVEETPAEGEEVIEETTEEVIEEQPAEETTEEVVEEEVKEESETEETTEEVAEDNTEEVIEVAPEVVEMIESIDAQIEELKEAVQTKDFSKVIERAYSRCFDAIEEHEDLIENIDELKESMNELADKLEAINTEDTTEEVSEEVTEEVKEESAKDTCWEVFNKETGMATGDNGTFDEVGEIVQDLGASFGIRPCGEKRFSKYAIYDRVSGQRTADESDDPVELRELLKNEYENPGQYEIRGFAEEVVEVVDETPATEEVSDDDTIQAVAENAAEQAVADYMEGQLILGNENEDAATLTLSDEELAPRTAEVDKFNFIDDKDLVIDTELSEEGMTDDEDEYGYSDELILGDGGIKELCNTRKFSAQLDLDKDANPFGDQVLSVEQLLGF